MLLFSPGPGTCHPFVQRKEALPIMHHRSEEFKTIFNSIVAQMKLIIQSKDCEIVIQNGSGSTGMETSLMNLFEEGDTVIGIDTGYFGERFVTMARNLKLHVLTCTYVLETYRLEDIELLLKQNPDVKGVLVTHSDSSNAILNELTPLGALCHQYQAILVVDGIGGVVMNPIHFDLDQIDCLIMASQKGFMMPPGLCIVALSKMAMQRVTAHTTASYTFNFNQIITKFHDDAKINTTPAISLYLALHEALCILNQFPISVWNHYYEALHEHLKEGLLTLGFHIFGEHQSSHSLIIVQLPRPNASKIQKCLEEQYDMRIELGLQDNTNCLLRIGCMNYVTEADIDKLLSALKALSTTI